MRRPHLALAGLILTLVPLSACSESSADPDASPSAPSTSAYPTILPTEAPALSQEPCDLLRPEHWARYVPQKVRKLAFETPGLGLRTGRFRTCAVRVGLTTYFTFGYAPADEVWAKVKKQTEPEDAPDIGSDPGSEEAESFATTVRDDFRLGEEAFIYADFLTTEGYALSRDVAYEVAPLNSFGAIDFSGTDLASTLTQMLVTGDQGVDPEPVALPEECPAADDPLVTALVGPVEVARGGAFTGIPPSCDYRGENGQTLSVSSSILPESTFEREYTANSLEGVQVLDPAPGPTLEYYPGREGEQSVWAMYPKDFLHISVEASAGDRAAALRLARSFLADHAPG